ncbi:MAG: protein kinase domain-containing protein [Thermoguttaceae bacterium]
MTRAIADSMPRRPLSQLLAEMPSWSLRERLALARRLALAIQELHRHGRIHGWLDASTITIDERFDPQLAPTTGPRRFGGLYEPEFCPPELALGSSVELPAEIEAAAAVLCERGLSFDPRRIDVYQFGVVLCQLLTGEPFLNYLYSPTCKAKVPPMARAVLESCLGENATRPLADCEGLVAALDDLIGQLPEKPPTLTSDTPQSGSAVVSSTDTPPQGKVVAPPAETPAREKLPLERLGHFQIVGQIGSGGMGDVYRGYDASLDRFVAIKVLAPALARDEEFVLRFAAEATAAAKLSHPNVVPIYFIGHDAGYHFFAMQFIEGQSLAQRLSCEKRLPVGEAISIIEECLAGLEAAHAQRLIHRDVKPGNILLERASGRAILVDFGLVRHLNSATRMTAAGVLMGTVDYVAPEQAKGNAIDGRTDIYSLGVMFYELLAGRLPFFSDGPAAMIFQHAYEEPFPLKQAAPDVPEPLVDIVTHMMAKEPADRYPSCAAVSADLRAFREGRPIRATSPDGVAAKPSRQQAAIASVPDDDEIVANLEREHILLPSGNTWQRVRDWAATIFRRHAPQCIQDMRGTAQQMDAAVAHCERRRRRLANLLPEARDIETALSEQIEAHLALVAAQDANTSATEHDRQAAQAKRREHEETVALLRSQHDQQRQQVEEIERRLKKADATLARLRSQQDLLKARFKAAEAHRAMEMGDPGSGRRRQLAMMGIVGGLVLGLALLMRFFHSSVLVESPSDGKAGSDDRGTVLNRVNPSVEAAVANPIDPAGAVPLERQVFIAGNTPYWQTLADMARRKGMLLEKSFNTRYDEFLPLAKGHLLLVETHAGSPIAPLPVLDKVYPGAADGLRTFEGIVRLGDTKIIFVDFSPLLKEMPIDSSSAVSPRRRVYVVGNPPYWQTLTDMVRLKGMTVTKSFNAHYDEWLPLAKGQILLIETHDGIPTVPLSQLNQVYPNASDGLKNPRGSVSIGNTTILFVDFSRVLQIP